LSILGLLDTPSDGSYALKGNEVANLSFADRARIRNREIGFIFQSFNLIGDLTVFENVELPLTYRGLSAGERKELVTQALDRVGMAHRAKHLPSQLSGGQQQRVALARMLATDPRVLLFDEPLSALDLKIRLDMEAELRRVHRATGATFVYVTHDQREAMALSDRIVVMNAGRVEQVGVPAEVYSRPASTFAAMFVGDANVLPVEVLETSGDDVALTLAERRRQVTCPGARVGPAWLVVRPEPGADDLTGVVRDVAFRGTGFQYRIAVDALDTEVKAEAPASSPAIAVDERVTVGWTPSACWLLARNEDAPAAGVPPPAREERAA
jgi:ABC-type Fe3+/spermidine/putrescine transport system ATPase subunit